MEQIRKNEAARANDAQGTTVIISGNIGGSVGIFGPIGAGASGSEGVAIDSQGNIALVMTGTVSGTNAGESADAMIGLTIANGTVKDQAGPADTTSAQLAVVGVDHSHTTNNAGKNVDSITLRAGLGEGASVSKGKSGTIVIDQDAVKAMKPPAIPTNCRGGSASRPECHAG